MEAEQPLWSTGTEEHAGSQVLTPVSLAISNICKRYSCGHFSLQDPCPHPLDMMSSLCSGFQTLSKPTSVSWSHPHTSPVPLRLFCCFQTFTPVVSLKYRALMYRLLFTGFLHFCCSLWQYQRQQFPISHESETVWITGQVRLIGDLTSNSAKMVLLVPKTNKHFLSPPLSNWI